MLSEKPDNNFFCETVSEEDISPSPAVGSNDVVAAYQRMPTAHRQKIERQLRRKIDLRILAIIVLIYVLNYLDWNSIAQARLFGLQEAAHLKGAMWQTLISIIFVSYIPLQIPWAMLMPKVRPSIALPVAMMLWGVVSGCTAFVKSTGSLLAVRFFLGVCEAPFFRGSIYFLSTWYSKTELGARIAFLVTGLVLSNAWSGLIAAVVLRGMQGVGHLQAWQWLFVLEALVTIVVDEERIVAQGRLAAEAGSDATLDDDEYGAWKGFIDAACDYRTWLLAGLQMATTATFSYQNFFPRIIKELGFKGSITPLLLTSPPYMTAYFWSLGLAYIADRTQVRSTWAGISAALAITGSLVLVALKDGSQWGRYGCTFILCRGAFGVYVTTYTWLSTTLVRPLKKRAAAIGICQTCANSAALFGNYFWLDEYAPIFTVSWGCVLAFACLASGCILGLRLDLTRRNKRFDRLAETHHGLVLASDDARAVHGNFRYVI